MSNYTATMTAQRLASRARQRNWSHVWVWVRDNFTGSPMAVGLWRVGPHTLHRDYDWGDGMGGPGSMTWGEWWRDSDRVNGYRNDRIIVKAEPGQPEEA